MQPRGRSPSATRSEAAAAAAATTAALGTAVKDVEASLAEKAGTLRLQLGLPDDRTLTETVDEAVTQLGLAKKIGHMWTYQKADICVSHSAVVALHGEAVAKRLCPRLHLTMMGSAPVQAVAIGEHSRWYWREDGGNIPKHNPADVIENAFVAYSGSVCHELSQAYHAYKFGDGPVEVVVDLTDRIGSTGTEQKAHDPNKSGVVFKVHFERMVQYNAKTGFARDVKRIVERTEAPPPKQAASAFSLGSGASAPVPQVMAMLDFPGKISAQELDGCWGATCCLCIPGAARVTSVNEDVYQQCPCFALLPCPHETLTRVPGTNKFISSNIDEYGSSAACDETVHSPISKDWSFGRMFR